MLTLKPLSGTLLETYRIIHQLIFEKKTPEWWLPDHLINFWAKLTEYVLSSHASMTILGTRRCNGLKGGKRAKFFVAEDCHPQTIALVETRGGAINLDIVVSMSCRVDAYDSGVIQPAPDWVLGEETYRPNDS